jgi:hypothetical protein
VHSRAGYKEYTFGVLIFRVGKNEVCFSNTAVL